MKLFKLTRKSRSGTECMESILAYHLEIFNINEPEILYKYRLPLHQMGSRSRDPVTFTIDLFNLVDHPFQAPQKEAEKKTKSESKLDSSKYKELFRKYIDNQLMIIIEERKFPANLSFSLVEPISRLMWNFNYEIQTEIINPAGFALIDQTLLENFLTAVYDTSQAKPALMPADSQVKRMSGFWHDQEKSDEILLTVDVNETMFVVVDKHKQQLRV